MIRLTRQRLSGDGDQLRVQPGTFDKSLDLAAAATAAGGVTVARELFGVDVWLVQGKHGLLDGWTDGMEDRYLWRQSTILRLLGNQQ